VQIDPTFELEGLPVGVNWRGAGKSLIMWQRVRGRLLADHDDQVGQALVQVHTTTRGREVAVVLLSSFCRRAGLRLMLSQENLSHRASDVAVSALATLKPMRQARSYNSRGQQCYHTGFSGCT
jgi:hypothetical protein